MGHGGSVRDIFADREHDTQVIKFFVSRLEKEPVEVESDEPAELLELDPASAGYAAVAPVHYHLTAQLISGGVLVSGRASTKIAGECTSCLDPVEKSIETGPLELFFELAPGQEECDVTEDIRAEMLLALPMNLRCSEDCRGLCPVCGVNRNRESCSCTPSGDRPGVWSALDDLKL